MGLARFRRGRRLGGCTVGRLLARPLGLVRRADSIGLLDEERIRRLSLGGVAVRVDQLDRIGRRKGHRVGGGGHHQVGENGHPGNHESPG